MKHRPVHSSPSRREGPITLRADDPMAQTFAIAQLEEMSRPEMQATDGGILPVIAIGAALLLPGCVSTGSNDVARDAIENQPRPQPDTTSR